MIADDTLLQAATTLTDRFGAETAARFGATLPATVAGLAAEWDLEIDALLDTGATSVVLSATGTSGAPLVLKLSPDESFLRRQQRMLDHLQPTGRVPAVVAAAPAALLLERVLPGDPLDGPGVAPPSPETWAALVNDLHDTAVASVPERLEARCEDMVVRIGTRQRRPLVRTVVPDETWARAVARCRELLADGADQVVLHGDLHLGNVLAGDDRGLVAIDPQMCVGDRCWDVMDLVVAEGDPTTMTNRAREIAPLLGVDVERVLAWSAADAVITAISRVAWYGTERRSAELLAFADRLV